MHPPVPDAEMLRAQRCLDYARTTAVLQEDHDVPSAAAQFEQALCNALAVIVEARWRGSEVDGKGKVKSAKVLLEVIVAEEAEEGRVGPVLTLEEPEVSPLLPVVPHSGLGGARTGTGSAGRGGGPS
jgi:hypothetical protein